MSEDVRYFALSPIPLSEVSRPKRRLFESNQSVTMVTKNCIPVDSVGMSIVAKMDSSTPRKKTRKEKDSGNKKLTRKDFLISELTEMSKQSILDNYNLNVRVDVKPKFYQQFARNKRSSVKYMFPYLALKNRAEDCWKTLHNGRKHSSAVHTPRTGSLNENLSDGNNSKRSSSKYEKRRQTNRKQHLENIKHVKHFIGKGNASRDTDDIDSDVDREDDCSDTSYVSYYTKHPTLTDYDDTEETFNHTGDDVRTGDMTCDDKVTKSAISFNSLKLDTDFVAENTDHNDKAYTSITSFEKYWKSGAQEVRQSDRNFDDANDRHNILVNSVNNDVECEHMDKEYTRAKYSRASKSNLGCGDETSDSVASDRHLIQLSTKEISTRLLDKVLPNVDVNKPTHKKSDSAACRRQIKLNKFRAIKKQSEYPMISYKPTQVDSSKDNKSVKTCLISDSVLNFRHKRIGSKKSTDTPELEMTRKPSIKNVVTSANSDRKSSGNMVVDFESVRIASHLHRLQKHANVVGSELGYKTSQALHSKCWGTMKATVPVMDERGFRTVVTGCAVK